MPGRETLAKQPDDGEREIGDDHHHDDHRDGIVHLEVKGRALEQVTEATRAAEELAEHLSL